MQINHVEKKQLKMKWKTTGGCHFIFVPYFPDNSHLCDDSAR